MARCNHVGIGVEPLHDRLFQGFRQRRHRRWWREVARDQPGQERIVCKARLKGGFSARKRCAGTFEICMCQRHVRARDDTDFKSILCCADLLVRDIDIVLADRNCLAIATHIHVSRDDLQNQVLHRSIILCVRGVDPAFA